MRPVSENTPYAMKWLPPGPKYVARNIAELKHEYTGRRHARPSQPCIKTLRLRQHVERRVHAARAVQGAQPEAANHLRRLQEAVTIARRTILTAAAAGARPLAREGLDPSRHQARQFPAPRRQRRQADRLQPRPQAGRRTEQAVRRQDRKCRARTATCRPSKSAASRSTSAPTSTASAAWSTNSSPASRRSPPTRRTSCCSGTSASKPQPLTVFDKNITPEFAAYVQTMMAKDPKDRPGQHERRDDGDQNAKNVLQPAAAAGASRRSEINSRRTNNTQKTGQEQQRRQR